MTDIEERPARAVPLHQDPDIVASGEEALRELRAVSPALVYAALLTEDGFEITHTVSHDIEAGRFAGMSSSVQALSEAVAYELRIGESGYVVIGARDGHVIQLRVPGHTVILAALFRSEETLGKALWAVRHTADSLGRRFAAAGRTAGA
jgi:uncharacterized protein